MPDRLRYMQRGDLIPHDQWNLMVDLHRARARDTGPDRIRTLTGHHVAPSPSGSFEIEARWAIVRVIGGLVDPDPSDLVIMVEYARHGRYYEEGGDPALDYGRWVGEHEYARTAPGSEIGEAEFNDYLHEVELLPHTVADDYDYFLYPHAFDPEHPVDYRDTHVDDTEIIPLWKMGGKWIAIPIYRDWNGTVDSAARRHDCVVESVEE